ncbi:hypothetical protein SLEP1_g50648 [Rubroshorea leprosula]|uniref:Uncharacterized protein n=1 Tax=Rubroshorea leprosula TaxID=152421 RepID=A0AAV5M0T1_9ROSI|nr:hypothetical protein SLEP1_g50648 [Rubroshorea leprosula]
MLQGDIPNKFLEGGEGKEKKGPEPNHIILQRMNDTLYPFLFAFQHATLDLNFDFKW